MRVANSIAALSAGVRTLDSSIGGLGECPYSPGATAPVLVPFPFKLPPHISYCSVIGFSIRQRQKDAPCLQQPGFLFWGDIHCVVLAERPGVCQTQ